MTVNGRIRALFLVIGFALVASACAWGQAGGNAARSSSNPIEASLTTANIDDLGLAWQTVDPGDEAVLDGTSVFVTGAGVISAYAADGPASAAGADRCAGTPVVCQPVWSGHFLGNPLSNPVLDGEQVFATGFVGGHWKLFAFPAHPTNCSALPGCAPSWIAQWGDPVSPVIKPTLAVTNDRVYVQTPPDTAGGNPSVSVFDEHGVTNCVAGTPRTCSPLFHVTTDSTNSNPPPVAVGAGGLFVPGANATFVFDAKGQTGCSNGICTPRFQLATGAAQGVSLFGTTAYAASGTTLSAFDATGTGGCAGSPRTCTPTWTATLGSVAANDPPTISGGKVMVVENGNTNTDPGIEAFDASGAEGCTGVPAVCTPLWTIDDGHLGTLVNHLAATPTVLIVAGWSGSPGIPPVSSQMIRGFDLSGATCSGSPKRCTPLSLTLVGSEQGLSHPAVAFGKVVVSSTFGPIKVYALPRS